MSPMIVRVNTMKSDKWTLVLFEKRQRWTSMLWCWRRLLCSRVLIGRNEVLDETGCDVLEDWGLTTWWHTTKLATSPNRRQQPDTTIGTIHLLDALACPTFSSRASALKDTLFEHLLPGPVNGLAHSPATAVALANLYRHSFSFQARASLAETATREPSKLFYGKKFADASSTASQQFCVFSWGGGIRASG